MMTMYGACIIDTVQCVTTKMPMNHTMYDPKIADTPHEECPKIVDEVAELWHSRLPIDCKRYDPNIADRSYDVLSHECR